MKNLASILTTGIGDATRLQGNADIASLPEWRRVYWLYAMAPPAMLYGLEALKTTLYHVARSPNMALPSQLALMFLAYGVWALVPRLIWAATAFWKKRRIADGESLFYRLLAMGLVLASFHLFLFTLLRLVLHATKAWLWRPIHILHNYGEIWLSFGAVWMMAYTVAALLIVRLTSQPTPQKAQLTRYEVRQNGKTILIPLAEIFWVKAAGNYVELHTGRGVFMVRKTLSDLSSELDGAEFLKAHRSALINSAHVVAIKNVGSSYAVQLSDGTQAPLSRRRLTAFKNILLTSNSPDGTSGADHSS